MNAAAYLERCGLILELRGILEDEIFEWIDRARTTRGRTARELINELLNRRPPPTVAELREMRDRVISYHLLVEGLS